MECICCKNNDKKLFEDFNYKKSGTMNYPKEMDDSIIKYCIKCSFSFCYPNIDNKRLNLYYSKYYNGKSIKSDSHLNNSVIRSIFYDERSISQISLINNFINLNEKSILDIGSGSALFFLQLNSLGFNNTKKYIIEPQIQNKNWYSSNDINIIEEDIFNLSEKYFNKFDLIFMSHSLEHFNSDSIIFLFRSINKLLKKGGKLFVEVPNVNIKLFLNSGENMQPHLSFFTQNSLSLLMNRFNFNILYSATFGFSQKNKIKKPDEIFILNKDNMYINKKAQIHSQKTIKKRKLYNKFLNIFSIFLSKKFIIFIKDFYNIFIKKNKLNMNSREFQFNNNGEFLRILSEKINNE